MYRYIKASLSPSIPDWLRSNISSHRYSNIANNLRDRYHIALDKATFEPGYGDGHVVNIYKLIDKDWGYTTVYIPGVNDNETISVNGRYRTLGKLGKKTLNEIVDDVVHVDLDNPNNLVAKREPYQDPRRTYRHGGKHGQYAGQTYSDYRNAWSEKGMTPSNESRARDKSGYKIPSPSEMLTRYYENFPENITAQVDKVYHEILDARDALYAFDFNKAYSSGDYSSRSAYRNANYRLGDAVDAYRETLNLLDENGNLRKTGYGGDYGYGEGPSSLSKHIREIRSNIRDLYENLDELNNPRTR